MPYITVPVRQQAYQISFEDMLNGINEAYFDRIMDDTHDTRTVYREVTPPRLLEKINIYSMIVALEKFNEKYAEFFQTPKESLYETFYLPKRDKGFSVVIRAIYQSHKPDSVRYNGEEVYRTVYNTLSRLLNNHPCAEHSQIEEAALKSCVEYLTPLGFEVDADIIKGFIKNGFRRIDAPIDSFKLALRELKITFEKKLYGSYHTAAFAYVKGRSTLDAVKRHQRNNSKWFLKLDFSNFFGATTPTFVLDRLMTIFPYNEIMSSPRGYEAISKALSLCFLNNSLPQGTPFSPTITNIMMIPIDHAISKMARESSPHLCYTRYADDLLISSELSFVTTEDAGDSEQCRKIIDILQRFNAPFSLNTAKTRYGSSAGRNWNLGVMLNKDNQITIGHDKKKAFKASLYSFLCDYTNGVTWSIEDVQVLQGQISYYKMVEKENIETIIARYNRKFNINAEETMKIILRQG